MSEEARYVRVGAFVLAGIALAVIGVLVLGGGALFRDPVIVETVFDESVQGLDVGSPVKVRGVKIGTVSSIGFVGDAYGLEGAEGLKEANRVLVRMQIDSFEDDGHSPEERAHNLEAQIEKGFRLRLTPLGITGTSLIQADYVDPAANPPLALSYTPEHIYVPSAPSTIAQISSAAERLMSRIDKLDVERLLTNFDTLLVSVNSAVGEADVEGVGKSAGELMADLRSTSAELRRAIAAADLGRVNREALAAIDQTARTLERLQRAVDAGGDDLALTLDNLRVASENLRAASETARAHPSLLLFGAPPAPLVREDRR